MRVALIGYGSVAAVHSRVVKEHAEIVTVYGPNRSKVEEFARVHRIPFADSDLKRALSRADAAIVCSPSDLHFKQASEALKNGVNTLVELPACKSAEEAQSLAKLAGAGGLSIQCAHTSRYMESHQRIAAWIHKDVLGDIRHAHYIRCIPPRVRSWADDALLHHAEHPLDLFLHWFGPLKPLGCAAHPSIPGAQDISLLASVCGNIPVALSISYTSQFPEIRMTIVGSKHTIATDGFTYIASDEPSLLWRGHEQQVYERAIEEQDFRFLRSCGGGGGGIPWDETIRLVNCAAEFAKLWNPN